MMSNTGSSEDLSSKGKPQCTGCSAPLSEHGWGIPSKFWEGKEKSSLSKHAAAKYEDIDEEIVALEGEFVKLALEEEKQASCIKWPLAETGQREASEAPSRSNAR